MQIVLVSSVGRRAKPRGLSSNLETLDVIAGR